MSNRSIVDFLREHRHGATHDELSDKLRDLVAAVNDTGKGGTLTFAIHIKPSERGGALIVTDDVKLSAPKPERSSSIFYASPENHLVRVDPRQQTLELREIAAVEPRDVG